MDNMPFFKQAMLDCIVGKYGGKYGDEIAVLWWTRGDVEDTHEVEFTDDEWQEIADRFNEMDWQDCCEEISELARQVVDRRENSDESDA
jgi:hypothetical protein